VLALVLDRPGEPLRLEEVQLDPPGPGEVQVRMLASGVCHSDLHVVEGEWGDPGPIVLGHEGCGEITRTGDGVPDTRLGTRVVLNWYASCQNCNDCRSGQPWTCQRTRSIEHSMADGTTRLHRSDGSALLAYLGLGTFSTEAVVPASAAVPIPHGLPPEVAALIGCSVSTGVGSVLRTAQVPAGASAVVFGLGGVGLSILLGLKLAGALEIVAVDRVQAKLDLAADLGATGTVLAGESQATVRLVREHTGGGADFAFEAVGLRDTTEQAVEVLRPGGTAVLVGMTRLGARASFDTFDFVDRSLRILGSNYGYSVPDVDFPRYARLFLAGRLAIDRLIDERIGLADANSALAAMRNGEGTRRVIVFRAD
jgi:S-(hydroxymethyl)glutathione dehydrogenase/alcohol dehydrogenase